MTTIAIPGVPTTEQGYANYGGYGGYIYDPDETSPDLQWPLNIYIYDKMRRTDAKVGETLASVTYPVVGTTWRLNPGNASDEVCNHVSADLGIPLLGHDPDTLGPRRRDRFSWPKHLRVALLMLAYGHMPFERVYEIGVDRRAHLVKLAPRMPRTLAKLNQTRAGDLVSIEQWPNYWPTDVNIDKPILADRLVMYTHGAEGSLIGTSLLRLAYKHWLLKDRLLRIDTMMAERNGMGIPIYETREGATAADIAYGAAMAQQLRAGPTAGGAVPFGDKLSIEGVHGTLPNLLPTIGYHDEAIAAITLAEFLKLGSSMTGSRAVGDTFIDFFTLALGATVEEVTDVANAEVVGNIVDLNWGPDEPRPAIVAEAIGSDHQMTAAAIKDLMDARAVTPDPALERYVREVYRLPGRETPWVFPGFAPMKKSVAPAMTADGLIIAVDDTVIDASDLETDDKPSSTTPPAPATTASRRILAAAANTNPLLPDRPLHRQPTAVEAAAGTDFRALDTARDTFTARAVAGWQTVRAAQITELTDAATAADGDLGSLAALSATPAGADPLAAVMAEAAQAAAVGALAEAARQGTAITPPDAAVTTATLDVRAAAMATLLAGTLGQAASSKAVALSGGGLDPAEVAGQVGDYLAGLTDSYLTDQLGGAVQAAQNTGRMAVMAAAAGKPTQLYASEIGDKNTCAACLAIDGTQFDTLDEAAAAYPGGLYAACFGGARCRGTVVAVYGETPTDGASL
ncbi:MAG: DUF935 domain-containing protein [Actinomycetota bacterium]|nr:DUF935 domain-containing protein [Actinomycetota bacterium]